MENLEIERRFVLYPCSMKRFLKSRSISCEKSSIVQFYLVATEGEAVRYRRRGDTFTRTVKRGSGLVRIEDEERIPKSLFEEALRRNRGGVIRKERFVFEIDGVAYELDSFKKPLKGLNILEVEFKSESEAKSFALPELFESVVAAEVTDNPDFTNGAISKRMRIPTIERPLKELLKEVDGRRDFSKASVSVKFTPYESAAHAVKAILYSLMKTVRTDRSAILEGTEDPERLHQLRVAMRKTRALLSQMGGVFDPVWRMEHKESLGSLMRETGDMRDLDVHIEEIEEFRRMLPKRLHGALRKMEERLLERRKSERERLRVFLMGEKFTAQIEELERFAQTSSEEGLCEEAFSPLILPVKSVLKSRYAKVLKRGSLIDKKSPAEEYHAVRIDVKKLRYMMEFFSSIFDEEAYRRMASKLKSIQTVLGKHQDLDVQSRHIDSLKRHPDMQEGETLEVLEVLKKRMDLMQMEKRAQFRREFREFSKTQALFKKMICRF